MNNIDGTTTAGRKGISYDWQSLLANDVVSSFEAQLADLGLESAE